jgi:hypothetical protein
LNRLKVALVGALLAAYAGALMLEPLRRLFGLVLPSG